MNVRASFEASNICACKGPLSADVVYAVSRGGKNSCSLSGHCELSMISLT